MDDLSLVETAIAQVEAAGDDYLEASCACVALAACEVLARLRGNPGYNDCYTKHVDSWVSTHEIAPSMTLVERGAAAIDRVLNRDSELAELWNDTAHAEKWRQSVLDLRRRLTNSPM